MLHYFLTQSWGSVIKCYFSRDADWSVVGVVDSSPPKKCTAKLSSQAIPGIESLIKSRMF